MAHSGRSLMNMIPPRAVFAAVDFSDASRVALAFAGRLATHTGADLHVLHADDPLLEAAARLRGVDLAHEAHDELAAFTTAAIGPAARPPHHHVVTGPAVEVICTIAERESCEVIVLGARGMSGASRMMFGSTTEGVLRRADRSVFVVPDDWMPPRPEAPGLAGMGPIVAAVDFSAPAFAAARAAAALATVLDTTVEAVHVVPPLPVPQRWSAYAESAVQRRVDESASELAHVLRGAGHDAPMPLRVVTGRVAEHLAEAVEPSPRRHPILVMGRRSYGERGGAPGSTAYRVLTLARVPVLMYLQKP